MVSYETLKFIQRLTKIKGADDTEVYFGGLNIVAVGDFQGRRYRGGRGGSSPSIFKVGGAEPPYL